MNMLLFLLLLLPLSFVFYCVLKKDKQIFIPAFIGFFSAVLVCAIKAIFTFTHRVVPYNFVPNLIYFIVEVLLPLFVIYGVYFGISRDSLEYRCKSFFSLICPFYMIYIPYFVISITESEVYSEFFLFIFPVLILAMLVELSLNVNYLFVGFTQKNKIVIVLNIFLAIVFTFVPAVISSLYTIGFAFPVVIVLSLVYVLAPAVYYGYLIFRK